MSWIILYINLQLRSLFFCLVFLKNERSAGLDLLAGMTSFYVHIINLVWNLRQLDVATSLSHPYKCSETHKRMFRSLVERIVTEVLNWFTWCSHVGPSSCLCLNGNSYYVYYYDYVCWIERYSVHNLMSNLFARVNNAVLAN